MKPKYSALLPSFETCHEFSCLLPKVAYVLLGAFVKLRKATVSFVMSVCPFVRMEQLGSHWTDFHEILFLSIFRKSVEKNQVSLKSDPNNWYFTWRPMYIHDSISLVSSWNEKCFGQNLWRKSKRPFYVQFSPPENRFVHEIWKNIVQTGRPQMKIWRMGIACWLIKLQTLRICNAYCFPVATMVARTRLDVTP